jgi:hypothetical protein
MTERAAAAERAEERVEIEEVHSEQMEWMRGELLEMEQAAASEME